MECLLEVRVLWVIRGVVIGVSCVKNWLVGVGVTYLLSGVHHNGKNF